MRDRDIAGRIGDGATVIALADAVTVARRQLERVEHAFMRLGLAPCTACGEWWNADKGGPMPALYRLAGHRLCLDCAKAHLHSMAEDDGPEWDDFDGGMRTGALEDLAMMTLIAPVLAPLAEKAISAVEDADLGLAWMAAKHRIASRF